MPKTKASSTKTKSRTSTTRAAKPTKGTAVSSKSNGRKKGFKKSSIKISDETLSPFYILKEDRQFVKMKKGSTIPQGYYINLANAVKSIAGDLMIEKNASKTLSLRGYIDQYEQIQNQILEAIKL